MSEEMNMNSNGNPYQQNANGNPYQQNVNGAPYQQPVTFVNPMQNAPKKPMDRNDLISWIIRGVLILAEVLFLLPQCLISCSYYEEEKWVGGLQAVFGFTFHDEKVKGLWWFIFVFLITGVLIAVWFVKDIKAVKEFKLKQPLLCLITAVGEFVNIIVMFTFVREGKALATISSCEFKVTFFFVLLVIIDILLALAGAASLVYLLVTKPDIINSVGDEAKKLLNYKAPAPNQQPYVQPQAQPQPQVQPQPTPAQEFKFCTKCGAKIAKEAMFCTSCGNKFE